MQEQAAKLMAEKIVRELFRLGQAYGQTLPASFDDLLHDFTVMIQHDDLAKACLLFHDAQQHTLLEYAYHIRAGRVETNTLHDPVGGLAIVPMTEPFFMKLIVSYNGKERGCAPQLRIRWSNAPTYTRNSGDQCFNPHFSKKTGGRAGNDIYADHHLRKHGRVKFFLLQKQYGFITPDEVGAPEVFFHATATTGQLQAGERVSYLPLVTPQGIQARAVVKEETPAIKSSGKAAPFVALVMSLIKAVWDRT
jgi:cold shock CspA family protein